MTDMPNIASLLVFPFFLLFARVTAAVMVFPGLSDLAISQRVKILMALMISVAFFPLLAPALPPLPGKTSLMLALLGTEIFIGIAMAMSARLFFAALNVAGEMIGFSAGLHASSLFDPRSGASTTAPALFLLTLGVTLIFITNTHHFMLMGIYDSYTAFPPGKLPAFEDTAYAITNILGDMFLIGIKLAAPVMTVGFLTYMGFGIFNRMVPQMHVFFVALPITIVLGIMMLAAALDGMMHFMFDEMQSHIILFTQEE